MKIAIQDNPKDNYAAEWVKYCQSNNYDYKLVNYYDNDIVAQLSDCNIILWHHNQSYYQDLLFAKGLLASLEQSGKIVYPNHNTGWHFDDKVGEKYLFESLGIPAAKAHVFYDKTKALKWSKTANLPIVAKLRGGAGAVNVFLIKSRKQLHRHIKKSFGKGFSLANPISMLKFRYERWKNGTDNFMGVIKGLVRLIIHVPNIHLLPTQKGYAYFQEFVKDNRYDTRVVVISEKYAIAEKRYVRKGDFRASGSGLFDYKDIDLKVIEAAFKAAKAIKAQSVAFDFVKSSDGEPLLIESSYGFGTHGIEQAPGYWTNDMIWHEDKLNFYGEIIEACIKRYSSSKQQIL